MVMRALGRSRPVDAQTGVRGENAVTSRHPQRSCGLIDACTRPLRLRPAPLRRHRFVTMDNMSNVNRPGFNVPAAFDDADGGCG
jgi:hypothetical protein